MSSDLGSRFSKRRRIAIIVTLGLLTGLGPFTIDLYLPAFPSLKGDLGITDAQVQVTLSATTLGFAIGQLVIGPWSDRIGRRVPLMVASSLHVAASVLVAVAPNVEFLTAMRALQGIGAAGGAVVAMAMARDLFDGRALVKTLARLSLISGLAPILAPILGSWMVTVMSWRGIFWGLALYGAVIIALVLRFTVETRPPAERTRGGIGPLLASYRTVVSDRIFLGALLVASFGFAGLFSYVSTSSVLLQEVYGLSAQGFGAVFATCSVGIFVGIQTGARLALRVGSHWMIACGNALMILAAAGVLAVNDLLAVFDFPCLHPAPHLLLELRNPVTVILADNKALHPDALLEDGRHQQRQTIRSVWQTGGVIAAHQPADRNPRRGVEQRQHRVKNLAADVFIINVNTLRAGLGQLFGKVRRAMVKADIKA